MRETSRTIRRVAGKSDNEFRRLRSRKRSTEMDDWTYMLILTVGAALLTGIAALPVTMPGAAFGASYADLVPHEHGALSGDEPAIGPI